MRSLMVAVLGTAIGALAGQAEAQTTWNLPTPYADGNFHTQNIKTFTEEVGEATGGKLRIVVHSGASLYKLPEIKRAVQSGQVQVGETLVASLANEDPIFEADTVPFLAQGFDEAKKLYDATRDHMEQRLQEQGLRLLFSVPWPTQGIYTREPVDDPADFKGAKMRTYNTTTSRFAELLGAVPTNVQAAEVPQAFATGLIHAMITSAATGVDTQVWDYVQNYYDVRMMYSKNMVIANERAFNALDESTRDAVLKAARDAEERGWRTAREVEEETTRQIAQKGVNVFDASPAIKEELKRIGSVMSEEWAKRAGADGEAVLQRLK